MKSIYNKQPKKITSTSVNYADGTYDLTERDLAILKLRELREQHFLRQAKRASQEHVPVGIYIFITVTVFIAIYLITQSL